MREAERSQMIVAAIALIPYAVIAWAYTHFDGSASFWSVLGVLAAVRAVFAIIEGFGAMLAWRFHGRRVMTEAILATFKKHGFPPRKYNTDDVGNYLARIQGHDGRSDEGWAEIRDEARRAAQDVERMLASAENVGIFAGMRMHSACEAALERYSPRALAPDFGHRYPAS